MHFSVCYRIQPPRNGNSDLSSHGSFLLGTSLSVVYQPGDSDFQMQEMPCYLGPQGHYFLSERLSLAFAGSRWADE